MTFIIRALRYLFWLLIVSWSVAILQRIVEIMASGNTGPRPDLEVPNNAVNSKLVRDPICGMHMAEGLSTACEARD